MVPFSPLLLINIGMAKFEGTVFRFPLRNAFQARESSLVANTQWLHWSDVETQLKSVYFQQAKKALILLRYIRCLEFHLGNALNEHRFDLRWKVHFESKGHWTEEVGEKNTAIDDLRSLTLNILYYNSLPKPNSGCDPWIIVAGTIRESVLNPNNPLRRVATALRVTGFQQSKHSEIPDLAIAAQPSYDLDSCSYFNSLPMPAPTGLPINCHGHFSTTPDRRSIRTDDECGDWNKFLAGSCLPHMYFLLLHKLSIAFPSQYYSFWPSSHCDNTISQVLLSGFWAKLPECMRPLIMDNGRLFRVTQVIFDSRGTKQRCTLDDPVAELVKSLRPATPIIYESVLNKGLLLSDPDNTLPFNNNVKSLRPAFLRIILQEPQARAVLSRTGDSSLKTIFEFALDDGPLENLAGCFALRTANGNIHLQD